MNNPFNESNNTESLPELTRPRIRPYLQVIKLDENRVLFHSALKTTAIQSKKSIAHLLELINYLDGKNTISEIIQRLPHLTRREIIYSIQKMQAKGLLEDCNLQNYDSPYDDQKILFASMRPTESAEEMQKNLENSRIGIIGCGTIGATVVMQLAAAGVGYVSVLDYQKIKPSNRGSLYGSEDIGKTRVPLLIEKIKTFFPNMEVASGVTTEGTYTKENVQEFLHLGFDVLGLCLDEPDPVLCDWINVACVEQTMTWLPVWSEGPRGYVGPLIQPSQTPCFHCLEIRRQETSENFHEDSIIDNYLRSNPDHKVQYGTNAAISGVVANLAAWELVSYLSRVKQLTPHSYGKFLKFDGLTSQVSSHPVWKDPRCPVCSRLRHYAVTNTWENDLR